MQIFPESEQIDQAANAQRFMRDQDPVTAQMNALRIEVPATTAEDASKPSKQSAKSTQENMDQVSKHQAPTEDQD